jgi:hypothetical protein
MRLDRQIAIKAQETAAQFVPPDPSVLELLQSIRKPAVNRVALYRSWGDLADSLGREAMYWSTQAANDRDLRLSLERRSLLRSLGISIETMVEILHL